MGLIKSAQLPAAPAPFSMKDIEDQARSILLRARQQAEQIFAAAQAEADELRRQAHADGMVEGQRAGFAKGLEEGRKAGHDQALNDHRAALTAAVGALNKAAAQVDSSRRELQSAALTDVVNLAIAIAQRITKRLGQIDPTVAVANVEEALKLVMHASDIRIAIHPTQKATLDAEMPRLKLQFPALQHVQIVDDPALAPGGARIYTLQGEVDASIDEQLNRIIADLLPQKQEALA